MPAIPMVTVANKCSFPIILSVVKGGTKWEEDVSDQNGRKTRAYIPGEQITYEVKGFGAQRRLESNGQTIGEISGVVGGYGLTEVPQDFWDQWLKENDKPGSSFYPMISKKLIFAHSRPSFVNSQAKEQAKIKCGLEALIPQTFDRQGRRTSEVDERVSVQTLDRRE